MKPFVSELLLPLLVTAQERTKRVNTFILCICSFSNRRQQHAWSHVSELLFPLLALAQEGRTKHVNHIVSELLF